MQEIIKVTKKTLNINGCKKSLKVKENIEKATQKIIRAQTKTLKVPLVQGEFLTIMR